MSTEKVRAATNVRGDGIIDFSFIILDWCNLNKFESSTGKWGINMNSAKRMDLTKLLNERW